STRCVPPSGASLRDQAATSLQGFWRSPHILVGRNLELVQDAVRVNLPAELAIQPVLDGVGVRAGPYPHPRAATRALVDLVLPDSQRRVRCSQGRLEGYG